MPMMEDAAGECDSNATLYNNCVKHLLGRKRMEGGGSEEALLHGIGLVCRSTQNEGGLQVAFIHELLVTVGLRPHRTCLSRAGTAVSAPAAAALRAAGRLREKPPVCPRGARFEPCAHRCWVPPPLAPAKTGWASRSRTLLPPRKDPSRFVCGQPPCSGLHRPARDTRPSRPLAPGSRMRYPSGGAWPGSSAHLAVGVASGVVGGFGVFSRFL
jgi:hypothetical protein